MNKELEQAINEFENYIFFIEGVFEKMGFPRDDNTARYNVANLIHKVDIGLEWQKIIADYVQCLEIVDVVKSGGSLSEKQERYILDYNDTMKKIDYYAIYLSLCDLQAINHDIEIDFIMNLSGEVVIYSPVEYTKLKLPNGLTIDQYGDVSYNNVLCGKMKTTQMPKYHDLSKPGVYVASANLANFRRKISSFMEEVINISQTQQFTRENIIRIINNAVVLKNNNDFPDLFLEVVSDNRRFLEAFRSLIIYAKNNGFASELFNIGNKNYNNSEENKSSISY